MHLKVICTSISVCCFYLLPKFLLELLIFSYLFVGDLFILGKLALCYMSCKWIHLLMGRI